MSIYAGPFCEIKVNIRDRHDPEWVEIFFMSVLSHIGYPEEEEDGKDVYGDFLPPPCTKEEYEKEIPRAIVVVAEPFHKKEGQQYVDALMTISGTEWGKISFSDVLQKVIIALRKLKESK